MNVHEKISKIRSEIVELNNNICKKNITSEELSEIKKDHTKKSFALKKFQSILGYNTYKKREKEALRVIDSNITTTETDIIDMDSFMEERIKADFIKKWPRLNKWQKKNRITKFAKEYGEKNSFNKSKIRNLIELILKEKLTISRLKYEEGEIKEIVDFDKILKKLDD